MSNSPSISYVILLHHQLLTASAHLRHRSRMQCNAGVRKTAQLHFRIQQSFPCQIEAGLSLAALELALTTGFNATNHGS